MTDDSLQRESFEKWYALHWHRNELSERIADDYVFPLVQEKWECWLAALSAQTEARDAARYRWLRDHCNYGVMGSDNPPFALNCDEPASEWDAAIDREIAQGDL